MGEGGPSGNCAGEAVMGSAVRTWPCQIAGLCSSAPEHAQPALSTLLN